MKTKLISIAAGCCLAAGMGVGSAHAAPGSTLIDPDQPALDCGVVQQAADKVIAALGRLGMVNPDVMMVALAVSAFKNLPMDGVLGCLKT